MKADDYIPWWVPADDPRRIPKSDEEDNEMAKGIPFADKPAPVVATVKAAGRTGGVLQKVAAGKMGHSKQQSTPVKTGRGSFTVKG